MLCWLMDGPVDKTHQAIVVAFLMIGGTVCCYRGPCKRIQSRRRRHVWVFAWGTKRGDESKACCLELECRNLNKRKPTAEIA